MDLLVVKRVLGLCSVGVGLLAVAAPDKVARFIGIEDKQAMSAFGARELAAQRDPGGIVTPDEDDDETDVDGDALDRNTAVQGVDEDEQLTKTSDA